MMSDNQKTDAAPDLVCVESFRVNLSSAVGVKTVGGQLCLVLLVND